MIIINNNCHENERERNKTEKKQDTAAPHPVMDAQPTLSSDGPLLADSPSFCAECALRAVEYPFGLYCYVPVRNMKEIKSTFVLTFF